MRKILLLVFLVLIVSPLAGGVEVDRSFRERDYESAADSNDFILSSPDRKWLTSATELPLYMVEKRTFVLSIYEGNSRAEYYRSNGPGYPVQGFKPTFGIGLNEGKSILIDEYLREADYDTVLFFSGGGPRTLASIKDILTSEEISRRLADGGRDVRWLASAEVDGNNLKLRLCGRDGKPAVPERVVVLDMDKKRPFGAYGRESE